jgi:hypothetical protein
MMPALLKDGDSLRLLRGWRGKRGVVNGRNPFVEESLVGFSGRRRGSAKARVCISAHSVAALFCSAWQLVKWGTRALVIPRLPTRKYKAACNAWFLNGDVAGC